VLPAWSWPSGSPVIIITSCAGVEERSRTLTSVVEADEAIAAVDDQVGVGGKQLRGARARDLGHL
jgi:hypothetical protein